MENGDLTTANVDMIVQQNNCIMHKPHGLSDQISRKLGVNPYAGRSKVDKYNEPGSVSIYLSNKTRPKYVACLFAQFGPSKPETYYKNINKKYNVDDSFENREKWFYQSLCCLSVLKNNDVKTIAFPYLIGCGLAGGNWNHYHQIIVNWSNSLKEIKVIYYKIS